MCRLTVFYQPGTGDYVTCDYRGRVYYRDSPDAVERAFRAYAALNADERARFEARRAKLDRWGDKRP